MLQQYIPNLFFPWFSSWVLVDVQVTLAAFVTGSRWGSKASWAYHSCCDLFLICCLDCVVHVAVKDIIKDELLQYHEFIVTIRIKKEKDSRGSKRSFGWIPLLHFAALSLFFWLGFYPRDSAKLNNQVWVENLWSYMNLGLINNECWAVFWWIWFEVFLPRASWDCETLLQNVSHVLAWRLHE